MTPLLGTKNPSAPVGAAPAGDNKAAQATAAKVFTKHETRDTNHGLCCGAAWGGYGAAWAATVPRTGNTVLCISRNTRHETRITAFMLFFPRLPAKKMSQAVVASQYGRRSRGPGRVPRAAPRQPGCTAEQTNHEPRSFLARVASRREFRGFHETRVTKHESRPFFSVGAPGRRHRKPPSGPLRPPASHCFPVHRCSPLFTIVHYCSPLFT